MTDSILVISVSELCQYCDINIDSVVAFVEHGILEPRRRELGGKDDRQAPTEWEFESTVISVAKSAVRMQRDLGVNWEGVALALELIGQRERLSRENEMLRRRLNRFLLDDQVL